MVSRTFTGLQLLDQLINVIVDKFSKFFATIVEQGRVNELKKEFQKKLFTMDENGNDCFTVENNQLKLTNKPLIFELAKRMTLEVYQDPQNRNRYKEMKRELIHELSSREQFLDEFINREFQNRCCITQDREKIMKKLINSSNMDVVPFISFTPVKKRNKLNDIIDSSYTEIHHWLEYVDDLEEDRQKVIRDDLNEFFDSVIRRFVLTEEDEERFRNTGIDKFWIFDANQEIIKMIRCCRVYIPSELPFLRFNMKTEDFDEVLSYLRMCRENVEIIEKELTIKPAKIEFEIKEDKKEEKIIRKISEGKEFSPNFVTDIISEDQKIVMYGIKLTVNGTTETYYIIRFKGKKIDKVCITGPLEKYLEELRQSI